MFEFSNMLISSPTNYGSYDNVAFTLSVIEFEEGFDKMRQYIKERDTPFFNIEEMKAEMEPLFSRIAAFLSEREWLQLYREQNTWY